MSVQTTNPVAASLAPTDQKKCLPNRFSTNTVTVLGAQAGRILITALLEVVYARLLGPSGRGQMGLCMMVIGFGALVGGLGGEIPIIRWSADEKKKPSAWLPTILLTSILGSLLAACGWIVLYWFWHPAFLRGITNTLALLLLLSIPFSILGTHASSLLVGLDRLRERSILVISNQLLLLVIAGILLSVMGSTAETAVLAILIALIVTVLVAAALLRNYLRIGMDWASSLSQLWPALSLGIRGQLGNVATFFNYRLDVFIVNYYLNTSEVGLYALGVMISEALWQVPNAAAMAIVPRTARSLENESPDFTCLVCRQLFLFACVSAVAVTVLSPRLVPLIFGSRFLPSVPVIWWILPGTVALACAKLLSADLMARGWPQYCAAFSFVTLIVTAVLDLYLIPRKGIHGAAIASSVAYLFNSLLVALVFKWKLRVTWKAMYAPTLVDLDLYRQLWNRVSAWLNPSPAV